MLYLGLDPTTGKEIGVRTERHAISFGGARSGKGAAQIIPNAMRWPHNLLLIDPKGENAEATYSYRETLGQTVAVLDPFGIADVPDYLRRGCNLLAAIDPNSLTAREDIRGIADGVVMRYKAEDATWDNGAVSVIAGLIDYVLATHPGEERDLTAVRRLLTLPPDALKEAFKEMAETPTRTGLARAAAAIGLSESKKNREFVSGAVDHTEWLDSPAMASILKEDGIQLSNLKSGNLSLYLVLPPEYLAEHGRFLRLFVRVALDAMAKGRKGRECLFLLDEFFSLGHIDQIAKAAGLMPGYGVHLWPILQDLGQLVKLYGREGAETFFGNADVHVFFGNTDALTLDHISARLGKLTPSEVVPEPPERIGFKPPIAWGKALGETDQEYNMRMNRKAEIERQKHDARHQNERTTYEHQMRLVGQPRMTATEIRELIGKKDGDKVARSMIVFGKGGDVFNIKLAPYFLNKQNSTPPLESSRPEVAWQLLEYFWRGLNTSPKENALCTAICLVICYFTTGIDTPALTIPAWTIFFFVLVTLKGMTGVRFTND